MRELLAGFVILLSALVSAVFIPGGSLLLLRYLQYRKPVDYFIKPPGTCERHEWITVAHGRLERGGIFSRAFLCLGAKHCGKRLRIVWLFRVEGCQGCGGQKTIYEHHIGECVVCHKSSKWYPMSAFYE